MVQSGNKLVSVFFLLSVVCSLALQTGCTEKTPEPQTVGEPQCLEDIYGSVLALGVGCSYDIGLEAMDLKKHFTFLNVGGAERLMAVSSGKADYTIVDSTQAMSVDLKSMGLEIKFGGVIPHGYSLLFSRRCADYCELFNEFLVFAQENGIYERLFKKWTTDIDAPKQKEPLVLPTEGEPVRVGIGGASFPWVYYTADNGTSGFQADMMDYFSVWSGKPVKYVTADDNALPVMLETGRADCLFYPLQRTPEREKAIVYSDPYFYEVGVVVGRIREISGADAISFTDRVKNDFHSNLVFENRWKMLVDGLWVTLLISVLSIIASLLFGALICSMRMSSVKFLSGFAKAYISIVRSIPMLVLLMIMFYVVFKSSRMSGIWISVICFAVYHGAYFSEMFRSGIESVSKGQYEAGTALGFNGFQTFRIIVLPQALLHSIPVLKGEVINLIKSTSLVGYVAVQDLTRAGDLIRSRTMDAFFLLLLVALVYALISWGAGALMDIIEKRITPGNK